LKGNAVHIHKISKLSTLGFLDSRCAICARARLLRKSYIRHALAIY